MRCFFVSDLHGHRHRYEALFAAIADEAPAAVFLGGDLYPSARRSARDLYPDVQDFFHGYFLPAWRALAQRLGSAYPEVFLILGNDDARGHEGELLLAESEGLLRYAHGRRVPVGDLEVFGYAYVPPTPFRLKDWERYDVSHYVDPGCIAPEDGMFTTEVDECEVARRTIAADLEEWTAGMDFANSIMLFHTPPYDTDLDRAALDGKMVDHVPLDTHIGSIALRRFILAKGPRITLHGHVHESASITGAWKQRLGDTWCYSAAHRGRELALVRFDSASPETAERELL